MSVGPARPTCSTIWKPDRPSSACVTETLCTASAMSGVAGRGNVGPMSRERLTPSNMRFPWFLRWSGLGQRRAQAVVRVTGHFVHGFDRIHRVIGIAETPERQRIAVDAIGDEIDALVGRHGDLSEQWQLVAAR